MDSVPLHPVPAQSSSQDLPGEPAEDPYSPGPQALPYLFGVLIAIGTATVPLVTVVSARSPSQALTGLPGAPSSVDTPAAWAREPSPPQQASDQR